MMQPRGLEVLGSEIGVRANSETGGTQPDESRLLDRIVVYAPLFRITPRDLGLC